MSKSDTAPASAGKRRKGRRRKNNKRQNQDLEQQVGSSQRTQQIEPEDTQVQDIELSDSDSYDDILGGFDLLDDEASSEVATDMELQHDAVPKEETVDKDESELFVAGEDRVEEASVANEDLFAESVFEDVAPEVELFADDSYADILGQFLDSDFQDDSESQEGNPEIAAESQAQSNDCAFMVEDEPSEAIDGAEGSLFAQTSVSCDERFDQDKEVSLFAEEALETDLFSEAPAFKKAAPSEERPLFEDDFADAESVFVGAYSHEDTDLVDDDTMSDESPDPVALREALESAKSYLDKVQEDVEEVQSQFDENTPLTEIAAQRKKSRLKFAEADRESGHGFFPKAIVQDHPEISLEEASQGHGFFEKSEIDSILNDLNADLGYSDEEMFEGGGGDSLNSGDFGFDEEELIGATGERQYVDTAQYSSLLDSCLENVDEMAEDPTPDKKDSSRQDLKRRSVANASLATEAQDDPPELEPLKWTSSLYLGSGIVSLLSLVCVCYLNFVTPRLHQEKEIKAEVLRLYGTHYQEFMAEDQFLELVAQQFDRVDEAALDFEENIKEDYDRNDIPLFEGESFKKNSNGLFYVEELEF